MAIIFASIAAFVHLYIFCVESLFWGRPSINRIFGISPELAEQNRHFVFNQGFYNLFLALGAIGGMVVGLESVVGKTLVAYALASMLLASIVLIYSQPKLWRPALVQGVPPLLGLLLLAL